MTAESVPDGILDDRDRSDCRIIRWSPVGRDPRRLVFLPRASDGPDWTRVEQVYRNGMWRTVGKEHVTNVALEGPRDG